MKSIPLFCILIITSLCLSAQFNGNRLPKIWMTYYDGHNMEEDFKDMKNHGVDAVEVGIWGIEGNSKAAEIFNALLITIELPIVSRTTPDNKIKHTTTGWFFNFFDSN